MNKLDKLGVGFLSLMAIVIGDIVYYSIKSQGYQDGRPRTVETRDVNGDGIQDIVVKDGRGGEFLFYGLENGSYKTQEEILNSDVERSRSEVLSRYKVMTKPSELEGK